MAQIKGKQLKDASVDVSKLSGVAADVAAGKLLLTGSSQATQALTLDGDLSQSINGSTITLDVAAGAIDLTKLAASVVLTEAEGISSNDNDNTLPTAAAVKDYVDSSVSSSGSGLNFAGDSGTDSVIFTADTLSFVGGANITTTVTDNQVSTALDSHISIASATLSGNLLVGGNLTVSGTTTTVNSTEVEVADATFRLGAGTSTAATLATAGAGIIFGEDAAGISFALDSDQDFASTQSIDLASGKVVKIANTEVLSADGAAKVQSAVAGPGLTHTSGILSVELATDGGLQHITATGLSVLGTQIDHHDVNATITSGSVITDSNGNISKPSAVGSIELKINGVAYQQGINSAGSEKDWYFNASDEIVWHGDFDLDNTDLLTLQYTSA